MRLRSDYHSPRSAQATAGTVPASVQSCPVQRSTFRFPTRCIALLPCWTYVVSPMQCADQPNQLPGIRRTLARAGAQCTAKKFACRRRGSMT